MAQTEHPRTNWETSRAISTELGLTREYTGCLGIQSQGRHEGSPEGWVPSGPGAEDAGSQASVFLAQEEAARGSRQGGRAD